mgnify:FL=1
MWHLAWHATVGHARRSGAFDRATGDLVALHARSDAEPIDWPRLLALTAATGLSGAVAELLDFAARKPGCESLKPAAEEASRLAAARRVRERVQFARHRLRHLAPFVGSARAFSLALWTQALRRPARLVAALVRH